MASEGGSGGRAHRWRPGPGLVVAAAFLGPGTVATATVAGARSGAMLLWVVVVAVLVTYVVQELAGRAPLATGRAPARLLAEEGPGRGSVARGLAWTAVGAVVLGAAAFQAGNLTGASLGLETLSGGARAGWVIATADVAFLLLWFGRYKLLERVLVSLVAVMGAAFLLDAAVAGIDWGAAARGLVPRLDEADVGLALALLGTTVVPYNLFLYGSALAARRRGTDEEPGGAIGAMRRDLAVSLVIGGAVTASVLLTAAAVLPGAGVEDASDMARAVEPLLGSVAEAAFGAGLLAAGLSSAITAPLAAALAVDQLLVGRFEAGRARRVVWVPVLAVGTLVALLPFEPVPLIVAAQTANAVILPLLALGFVVVVNRGVMGRWRNGPLANAAGLAALVATVLLVGRLLL